MLTFQCSFTGLEGLQLGHLDSEALKEMPDIIVGIDPSEDIDGDVEFLHCRFDALLNLSQHC